MVETASAFPLMVTSTDFSGGDAPSLLPAPSAFIEMMGGDPEICLMIVATALRELDEQEKAAIDAVGKGDGPQLTRILHSLRGASGTLGAIQFSSQLSAWEADLEKGGEIVPDAWPVGSFQTWCQNYRLSLERLKSEIIGRE